MRQPRMTVVLLMIALGVLGAWLGVRAQERCTDWPTASMASDSASVVVVQAAVAQPAPGTRGPEVISSDPRATGTLVSATQIKIENTPPTPSEVPQVSVPMPPAALPPSIVATEALATSTVVVNTPPKLPAEIPARPNKAEAKVPSASAPLTPELPATVETVKLPNLPDAPPIPPPVPATPSVPTVVEAPKQVIIPGPPPLTEAPEPLHLPRVKEPAPVVAAPPMLPPELPKIAAPGNPPAPPLATGGLGGGAPPAAGIAAKPLAPALKQEPPLTPAPLIVPEVAVPMLPSVPIPAAPIEVKQLQASPPVPMATAPIEVKQPQAPARPPAFLLVKPRRVEMPPHAAPPALMDGPRSVEVPLASSAAQVTVEKRGPSVLRQGVSATYQIIVRNRGAAPSGPITIVDEIPRLARLLGGEPGPVQHGDKAIWTLPPLPAHSETLLKLELEATASGDFVGNTTVFVSAASAVTRAKIQRDPDATTVSAGPLGIVVRGPVGGAVGQPVVFEVQVTNRDKQLLTELVLHAKLSEGLTHPAGNHIEADIGDLAPGATKTFKMPTTAVRSGRQSVDVKITATSGAEAKSQAFVLITASGLSIQTAPTSRLLLDRAGDIRIEVTNLQAVGLRNVVIADTLPENLQFVAASDRGIYQATTRTVQWLIDDLPAGETRTVTLRVQGKTPGQFAKEVSARAESLPETRAQSIVLVEGYTNLVLKVTPRDQPLELGKETVCEVRVQNLGSSAATGVQVQLAFPVGLTPGYVQGPTAHRLQGRTLVFEPIAQLSARTQAVYHVGMTAQAAGDLRLRAQVVSAQSGLPVVREVPLIVYRE